MFVTPFMPPIDAVQHALVKTCDAATALPLLLMLQQRSEKPQHALSSTATLLTETVHSIATQSGWGLSCARQIDIVVCMITNTACPLHGTASTASTLKATDPLVVYGMTHLNAKLGLARLA